jgi:hypothetical protein
MRRAIPPLLKYVFMAWCLVKAQGHAVIPSLAKCPLGKSRRSRKDNITSAWMFVRQGERIAGVTYILCSI